MIRILKAVPTFILISTYFLSYSQKTQIEILFRPTLTSLRGNPAVETNFNSTIHTSVGLGANYFVRENSIINVGLLFDKKGASGSSLFQIRDAQNQLVGEETVEFASKFDYITIPVEWGKRFGGKIKYQFGIGLYASYLLRAEQTQTGTSLKTAEVVTNNYTKLDFGLSASFSMYVPVGKKISAKIGLVDNLGLANISSLAIANNGAIRNNLFGLTIGLNYRLE